MKNNSIINIAGKEFKILISKDTSGAEFNYSEQVIKLGVCDEKYAIEILIHEISEIIHVMLGNRLLKNENNSYIFLMDHCGFQAHNEILVNTLINNKIIKL